MGLLKLQQNRDRSRSVSIRDVARAAGVSYQTVSRVINESPGVRGSTREGRARHHSPAWLPPQSGRPCPRWGPGAIGDRTHLQHQSLGFAAALEGDRGGDARKPGLQWASEWWSSATPVDVRNAVDRALDPAGAVIVIAFDRTGLAALDYVPPTYP